jgi:uncharacterized protein (TIGR00269 family)
MQCSQCTKESAAELKYSKIFLCRQHFISLFEKRVRHTIRQNKLLRHDDRIAVGLSSGKDSAVLLKILSGLTKKVRKTSIFAVTIDEGISGYSELVLETSRALCEEMNVEHHVFSFRDEIGMTLDGLVNKMKNFESQPSVCSYCGVLRRNLLNIKARELGATKLAIGHNLDDECQVMLMNLIRGDLNRITRMGTLVGVIRDGKFVPKIKPLRECPEDEIRLYANLNEIKFNSLKCSYAQQSFRSTIRKALNDIEEKHPGSKFQLLKSTDELIPVLREAHKIEELPNNCKICGELASGEVCKFCELLQKLKN